jgi:hypothetical protein
MYNMKLKSKVIRKAITLPFEDIQSDDEWITEEGDNVGDNVDVEGEGDGVNVQLDVGGSSNPTLDTFHLENIVFHDDLSEDENVDVDVDGDDEDLDLDGVDLDLVFDL